MRIKNKINQSSEISPAKHSVAPPFINIKELDEFSKRIILNASPEFTERPDVIETDYPKDLLDDQGLHLSALDKVDLRLGESKTFTFKVRRFENTIVPADHLLHFSIFHSDIGRHFFSSTDFNPASPPKIDQNYPVEVMTQGDRVLPVIAGSLDRSFISYQTPWITYQDFAIGADKFKSVGIIIDSKFRAWLPSPETLARVAASPDSLIKVIDIFHQDNAGKMLAKDYVQSFLEGKFPISAPINDYDRQINTPLYFLHDIINDHMLGVLAGGKPFLDLISKSLNTNLVKGELRNNPGDSKVLKELSFQLDLLTADFYSAIFGNAGGHYKFYAAINNILLTADVGQKESGKILDSMVELADHTRKNLKEAINQYESRQEIDNYSIKHSMEQNSEMGAALKEIQAKQKTANTRSLSYFLTKFQPKRKR